MAEHSLPRHHSDVPMSDDEKNLALEDLLDALDSYGRDTPRLRQMIRTAIVETFAVYQRQEFERESLLVRMYGPKTLGPPE